MLIFLLTIRTNFPRVDRIKVRISVKVVFGNAKTWFYQYLCISQGTRDEDDERRWNLESLPRHEQSLAGGVQNSSSSGPSHRHAARPTLRASAEVGNGNALVISLIKNASSSPAGHQIKKLLGCHHMARSRSVQKVLMNILL